MDELEKARKESLQQAFQNAQGQNENDQNDEDINENDSQDQSEQEDGDEKNSSVGEENLGNDNNSSYLENEDSDDDSDEVGSADQKDSQSVLDKVFGGNVENLENSYLESQREYNKLNQAHKKVLNEYNQTKQVTSKVEDVLEKNPALRSLFEKAVANEDVESLINLESSKPDGKSSNTSKDQGKLGVDDEYLPTTERLIESGYLDENFDNLNDFDRERAILTAQSKFMNEQMPNLVNKQVQQSLQEAKQKEAQQAERQQLSNTNTARFEDGFDKAVVEFGLNFTNEHKDLFDEIYEEAKSFRDPKDQRLIREDAVLKATQEVMNRRGIEPQVDDDQDTDNKKSEKKEQRLFTTTGKRQETSRSKKEEPQTIEDKMRQRQLERMSKDLNQRKNKYKLDL